VTPEEANVLERSMENTLDIEMTADEPSDDVATGTPEAVSVAPDAELSWFTGSVEHAPASEVKTHDSGPRKPPPLPSDRRPETTESTSSRLIDMGELARGGMATVRRAFDRNILRQVAIKRVDPEVRDQVPDAVQLLVEEAQITGQLEHPNIVPVYDLGTAADGAPLFVMRLVTGRTLTRMIRAYWKRGRNPIELREVLEVVIKVCDAIAYAHSRGVIHRDLKPDNVMIGSHGQVYVMDWGCALLLQGAEAKLGDHALSRRAEPNILMGTAAYMAPEQARGEVTTVDARSDIYSIGAIIYQLLTEQPPHRGKTFAESVRFAQAGQVAHPDTIKRDAFLPRGLVAIAMKALAHDPSQRFASAEELRLALDHFVAGIDWFPRRRFAAGETIIRDGEVGYTAYVIEQGRCQVTRGAEPRLTVLREMGPGDVFGETAIFTDQQRSATVTAIDEVVCIEITRSTLENQPGMDAWLGAFVRSLAQRFRDVERRLEQQRAMSSFGRIVEAVAVHLTANGIEGDDGRLWSPWSPLRRALAKVLGLDEDLVTEAVLGSMDLTLDEGNDTISGSLTVHAP
jgi:serine/threonine-protein kinase